MAQRIRGILFDLGDTLLDFGEIDAVKLFAAGAERAYEFLQQLRQPLPPFRGYLRRQLRAVRWHYLRSRITGREFNSLTLIEGFARRFRQQLTREQTLELAWLWYEPLSRVATVAEGLPAMLAELRASPLTLGVVSNTFIPAAVLDRHLAQVGLLEQLPVRVYSCDVGSRKPRAPIFREALRRAGLEAPETMFVGDSPRADIKGANRMGMVSVLKDTTGRYANGRVPADHHIASILEMPGIVRQYREAGEGG